MRALLAVAVLGCALQAQAPLPADLRSELARAQQRLRETELMERRVLDLRIASDLGLAADDAGYFALAETARARGAAEIEAELLTVRESAARMQQQLGELRSQVDARHKSLLAQAKTDVIWPERSAPTQPPPAVETPAPAHAEPAQPPPAVPLAETAAPRPEREPTAIAWIKGSRDHGQVGRALFAAGHYDKALVELEEAAKSEPPALIDLFHLARCLEQLGQLDRADDMFARVEALDSRESETGQTVRGGWASAAHTARQHMSWQRDRGGWKPKVPIESIQWRNP
jgi:tetratricopeptide (TPR) repeat protein